ncbi:MAG: hypothetical protein IJ258_00900 [Methanobrevibacter sp.]|uniref:hypothetical protein n=1 Tax=Methanobrevibacter sp. TaxID=66852 RepID=UPI0025DD0923|nr:hypothetical protein [Methanobrevibacter sp.]MBQ8016641.1 hypothetical protein [Methanobrevibacter sp.]
MIFVSSLKGIVHKLHLDDLARSMNECRKDTRGGFLIPVTVKLTDPEYERYRHLEINWEISPITKDDLPDEFSPQAVKTVDMFRRKTIDLPYECRYCLIMKQEILYHAIFQMILKIKLNLRYIRSF